MSAELPSIAPETLLSHRAWMCSLARSLVRDDAQAEDVVQDAMVRALRSPPRDRQALPAWLATVVRNGARQLWRGESRRVAREEASARREAESSPEAAVARAEEHSLVVQAVIALDEPYRSAILLRFFEEQSPAVVAERTGVPLETARTRIRRGLARLRERLDEAHGGDGSAWKVALVPLLAPHAVPVGAGAGASGATGLKVSGGVVAMATTGTTVAASVALALGLGAGWWFGAGTAAVTEQAQASQPVVDKNEAETANARGERESSTRLHAGAVAKLTAELEASRAESAALRERLAALDATPETDEPDSARSRGRVAFPFAEYAALEEVDWGVVGEHSKAMIELLVSIATAIENGERPPTELIGQLQQHNGAYVAATLSAARQLPGAMTNSSYTHPAFAVNAIAATLEVSGQPLAPEEKTALDRIAREFADEDARRQANYGESTLYFQRVVEEAELRTRFMGQVHGALTPEQRDTMTPPAVSGSLQFDLFGDGRIWGEVIEPIPYPDGDIDAFADGALSALDAKLFLSAEDRAAARVIVGEWARSLPAVAPAEPGKGPTTERAREAAAQTLSLVQRLVTELELDGTQLEAAQEWEDVILPMPQAD